MSASTPSVSPDPPVLAEGEGLPSNRLAMALGVALVLVSLVWTLDIAEALGFPLFDEQPLALAIGLAMAVVAASLGAHYGGSGRALAAALGLGTLALMTLVAVRYPELSITAMMRPAWLVALAAVVLIWLLFLVWRVIGLAIVLIVVVFALVALYGSGLGIPTTGADRMALYLLIDPNGLLGLPLRVAVEIVVPFVFFGELLRHSGGSEYLTQLSLAIFGRFRGGSAKAAVGASAVFGTISGNAVSNVVGTGVVTIPLMKKTGLRPEVAGAVEAAASTGGQLLPPVMGAAAFVMADYLQVPYVEVAIAAALPAFLYFAAIFIQVDRIAAKSGVSGLSSADRPAFGPTLRTGLHFLVPFVALFVVLFSNQTSPELAALAAVASVIVVAAIRPYQGKRLGPRGILAAIIATGAAVAPLLLITAAAGLIIGLVSLTGVGFSIAADAVAASGGNTLVLLALVAVIAVLFGMGMPTVAVYVVLATVLGPALVQGGLGEMQAHLFILYFGMMSMLTPPVALASITAAKIAGADMWRTSYEAVKLAWVAYIIPFLFAFSPELLLGGSPLGALAAAVTAFFGMAAVSVAAAGYARAPISGLVRLAFLLCGAALLLPPNWGLWVAIANALGALGFFLLFMRSADNLPRTGVHLSSSVTQKEKST